jgi:CRISPR-associated protein Cas2
MAESGFYVIAYDVTDDKRRSKVARTLEAIGERVQGSVFEAYLTPAELEKLLKKIKKLIKGEEDSLRVYLLCGACREKVHTEGRGKVTPPPGVRIV